MNALLIDGLNLVRRIYAAAPALRNGQPPNAADAEKFIRTCAASLARALQTHAPSHALAVFEQGGDTWRHRLFPDYKKKRAPMPPPLAALLPRVQAQFVARGVKSFARAGFESDDIIATIATKIAQHDAHCTILSTDRNYCQLLSPRIRVFDHFAGRELDEAMIKRRFDLQAWQLPHMLALAGDAKLSIPGVASVGERTAVRLIRDYESLDKVLQSAADIPGKLGAKIHNGRAAAELAFTLFRLKTDIDIGINLNQYRLPRRD